MARLTVDNVTRWRRRPVTASAFEAGGGVRSGVAQVGQELHRQMLTQLDCALSDLTLVTEPVDPASLQRPDRMRTGRGIRHPLPAPHG